MDDALLHGEGFSVRVTRDEGFLRAHVFGGRDSLEVSIAMWTLIADSAGCVASGDCSWSRNSNPRSTFPKSSSSWMR